MSGDAFSYLKSYRDVKTDPDNIWSGDDLAPRNNGTVSIFEYQLKTNGGTYLISQIWNDNCSISVCPTRLVKIDDGGSKKVLVDDMMHQVIPKDDTKFRELSSNPKISKFADTPFVLSRDGKTLLL